MPVTSFTPKSFHYGKIATTSRLIRCLVVEGLAPAYFVPWTYSDKMIGLCLLYSSSPSVSTDPSMPTSLLQGLLAVIPLRGMPELSTTKSIRFNGVQCPLIEMLDPWDMLPHIYNLLESPIPVPYVLLPDSTSICTQVSKALHQIGFQGYYGSLVDGHDATQIWTQFSKDTGFKEKPGTEPMASLLANSILNQTYTYDHPKPLPTLKSSTVEWEQSNFEANPIHPLHKARFSFPPMPPLSIDDPNLQNPRLRLVSFPKESIQLHGDFEALIAPLIDAMLEKTGDIHEQRLKYADLVLVPVHELQLPNIQEKCHDATIFPGENSVTGHALLSIRSIAIPKILPGLTVKLSLGVRISSSIRLIHPRDAYFGPRFSEYVLPRLSYDRKILTAEREFAGATYLHPDIATAKHCTWILREAVEYPLNSHPDDDIIIPAGALAERIQRPDTDDTVVVHEWKLDSEEKRATFLDRYIQLALKAFIPLCMKNGIAFKAHGQNTMVRFDRSTGELKGFVIRDFGSIRVHNETLKRSCGVELDTLPDSPVLADSMEAVYNRLYHSLIHVHLQQLIRVLGMHHNGRGWEMFRRYFTELVPPSDPMYGYFMLQDKIPAKSLVRMWMDNRIFKHIYHPVPNIIRSRPQKFMDGTSE